MRPADWFEKGFSGGLLSPPRRHPYATRSATLRTLKPENARVGADLSFERVRWKALSSAAEGHEVSRGSIVLAWLMSGVPPLIPLVAASLVEQLRENLDAGKIVLEAECLRDLTEAVG